MGVWKQNKLWGATSLTLAIGVALAGCSNDTTSSEVSSPPSSNPTGSVSPNANPTPEPAKVDPITISAFIGTPNQLPASNNKIYKKMKDELGVTLDMEFIVGDTQQKLGVMIAGGDFPDLITADTKLVAAGAVIPLEDLIEKHAPNLKKHYQKVWNKMKDPSDGHIYWLPNYGVISGEPKNNWYGGPAFWIQKDILKDAGYPTPKTLDEFMKLIRDYAAKNPTIDGQPTIGYTALAFDWRTFGLLNPPLHLTGNPNEGGVIVKDNTASVYADKDIAKRYYQELNKLFNEGLMDKEAFVQNYDQYLAKIASGRVLGMFDQHWNFQDAENTLIAQNRIGKTYVGFPIVYDTSIKEWYLDRPGPNLNNGFGISKDAKDPVRIIKFLDALMDEKWQKLMQWGEEGVDYMVNAKGKYYLTPEQRKAQEDPAWKLSNRAEGFFGAAPKMEGTYSDGNATGPGLQPEEFYEALRPEDKELLDAYGHKTWSDFFAVPPENPPHYPAWQIDLIEGSDAAVANQQMTDTSLKFLPRAIMSKPDQFNSVWAEYVNAYSKINVKAYEARINDQIQWRIKNWSN